METIMKNLEALIREAMKREGIDLVGFASKARFESVDAQHNPFSIFPEGQDGNYAWKAHLPRLASRS